MDLYNMKNFLKKILHKKFGKHEPDYVHILVYDKINKIVYTKCKHCGKILKVKPICNYMVQNDRLQIEKCITNKVCQKCISSNLNNNENCCPIHSKCHGVCRTCERIKK